MIQFRTRVFPTACLLPAFMTCMHVFSIIVLHVPEYIEHILLECPRWECHRRNFGTLSLKFHGFVRQFATSHEDANAVL
jgi:hypothetical protein